MSPKKKVSTCAFCKARGRNVVYYPLMAAFYHYECWLTVGTLNVREAFMRGEKAAEMYVNEEVDGGGFPQVGEPFPQRDMFE